MNTINKKEVRKDFFFYTPAEPGLVNYNLLKSRWVPPKQFRAPFVRLKREVCSPLLYNSAPFKKCVGLYALKLSNPAGIKSLTVLRCHKDLPYSPQDAVGKLRRFHRIPCHPQSGKDRFHRLLPLQHAEL